MWYRLLFLLGLAAVLTTPPGFAQSPSSPPPSPSLRSADEVYAPETIFVGEVANFRVRASDGTPRPFTALWDFDNGYLSVGNPVAHAYESPGTYSVRVIGRNRVSSDTLSVSVTVKKAPAERDEQEGSSATVVSVNDSVQSPSAVESNVRVSASSLLGNAPLNRTAGTYTWVIASDLWKNRVETAMLQYRLQNYRAELYLDTSGVGSPAYRIILGQFATEEEARAARSWLPSAVRAHASLMEFGPLLR